MGYAAHTTSRATALHGGILLFLVFQNRLLVIRSRLPLHERDRSRRTCRQTVSQAITVVISQEARLALHHADGALVTGFRASAAAVAFLFIYLNYFSNHPRSILSLEVSARVYYNQT